MNTTWRVRYYLLHFYYYIYIFLILYCSSSVLCNMHARRDEKMHYSVFIKELNGKFQDLTRSHGWQAKVLGLEILFGQNKQSRISVSGSGSLHRKIISPKIFDRKAIWPKHLLTEHRLTECIWPNAVWPKVHFTVFFRQLSFDRIYFRQKMSFVKCRRKFFWPKAFSENDHLTERSFDRKFIWPKAFFKKWSFDRAIWPNFFFWKIVVIEKLSFDRLVVFH
jgi:hypothetical protein